MTVIFVRVARRVEVRNPLVGKTIAITYETGFPGASVEIQFISSTRKISTGHGPAGSFVAEDDYEMAVVAPNVYMASWRDESDGHVVTAVWNLETMRAFGSYAHPGVGRIFMSGSIDEVRG
jgi:hypothetical protein